MAIFPGAVSTDSDLYIAVNMLSTQLTDNPLSAGATTVNVVDASLFPTVGFISIDSEIIKYTGKTGTSFTGCTRGADGTVGASHVQNSQVFHNIIAAHHNALKEEIKAVEQNLNDRLGLSASNILASDGTVGNPSYSFASDTDTGFFWSGTGAIRVGIDGIQLLKFYRASASDLGIQMIGTNSGFQNNDGTVSNPSYSFSSDPDTGLYRPSANEIDIVTGGSARIQVKSSFVDVNIPITSADGSVGSPQYTFSNDSDTGIYRFGTNQIGFSTAAAIRFLVDGTALLSIKDSSFETTGSGTALLGANSPAVTNTAPYKWLIFKTSDGSTVYVPAWK